MKRFFMLLLFLFPLLTVFGSVDAEYWDEFEYLLRDDGCVIVNYSGNENEVNIPISIDYYYVIEIGDSAFEGNESIVSLTMPSTVQKIGNRAFADCKILETVNISGGLTEIGEEAFYNCENLNIFTLPANLQMIGRRAFGGCKALSYLNDLTGYYPLKVGTGAFDDTEWYQSKTDDFITLSQGYTLLKYTGVDYDPELSWFLASIAEDAFSGNDAVTNLRLPNYLIALNEGSISGMSSLQSISGGASLQSVSEGAFRDLPELKSVELPTVKLTADNFVNCPSSPFGTGYSEAYDPSVPDDADEFFLSDFLPELDGIIILHCSQNAGEDGEIKFPDYIRSRPVVVIGEGACQNRDDISSVILPKYLIGIESWAFSYNENMDSVIFPEGLKWIRADAFNNSGITNYVPVLNDGVEVDERAFYSSLNK